MILQTNFHLVFLIHGSLLALLSQCSLAFNCNNDHTPCLKQSYIKVQKAHLPQPVPTLGGSHPSAKSDTPMYTLCINVVCSDHESLIIIFFTINEFKTGKAEQLIHVHGTKELLDILVLVLKARHLYKWLCLLPPYIAWPSNCGHDLAEKVDPSLHMCDWIFNVRWWKLVQVHCQQNVSSSMVCQ